MFLEICLRLQYIHIKCIRIKLKCVFSQGLEYCTVIIILALCLRNVLLSLSPSYPSSFPPFPSRCDPSLCVVVSSFSFSVSTFIYPSLFPSLHLTLPHLSPSSFAHLSLPSSHPPFTSPHLTCLPVIASVTGKTSFTLTCPLTYLNTRLPTWLPLTSATRLLIFLPLCLQANQITVSQLGNSLITKIQYCYVFLLTNR